MMTVSKVIEFIQKNNICKGWTDMELRKGIFNASYNNAIAFESHGDTLTSFCFGRWISPEEFYVFGIAGKGRLKVLVRHLKTNFPECKFVSGVRKGSRNIRLNVDKLLRKIK